MRRIIAPTRTASPRLEPALTLLRVAAHPGRRGLAGGIEWRCFPRLEPEEVAKLAAQVDVFPALGTMLDFRRRTASNAAITAPIYALQFEGSLEGTELRRHRARADAAITGQAGAEMR